MSAYEISLAKAKSMPFGQERALRIAELHLRAGRAGKAYARFKRLIKAGCTSPRASSGLFDSLLGLVLPEIDLERYATCVRLLKNAAAITARLCPNTDPDLKLRYLIGKYLNALGEHAVALAYLDGVRAQAPGFVDCYLEMFAAHTSAKNHAAAEAVIREGIAQTQSDLRLLRELATAQIINADIRGALQTYADIDATGKADSAFAPDEHAGVLVNRGIACQAAGQIEEARRHWHQALVLDPVCTGAATNLCVCALYDPDPPDDRPALAQHALCAQILTKAYGLVAKPADGTMPSPSAPLGPAGMRDKLRVGYVGAEFGLGSGMMRFLRPLLILQNADRFDVYVYDNGRASAGDIAEYRSHGVQWRAIRGMSTARAVTVVAGDRLDVLVDLVGYMDNNRADLFCRRLAPVQICYAAYLFATGLVCDWLVGDDILAFAPDLRAQGAAPRTYAMPVCYTHYTPPLVGLDVATYPCISSAGRDDRVLALGSMNKTEKLNSRVLACWERVIARLDAEGIRVRLLLKGGHRTTLKFGPATEKCLVRLPTRAGYGEYMHDLRTIDLALDTFPWTGTTTTCDYLLVGVPVITLVGPRFIQRSTASILCHSGLGLLVAESEDDYVRLALHWARCIWSGMPVLERATVQDRFVRGPVVSGAAAWMDHYEKMLEEMVEETKTKIKN